MVKVVIQIQRGKTAGKWRSRYEDFGYNTLIGITDTEKEAWELFDQFEDDILGKESISATKAKGMSKYQKKLSIKEWNRISKEQIKVISAKYI